jgi:tetratricopeptide (TPR) repeat protein
MSRQILAELGTRRAASALAGNDRDAFRTATEEVLRWAALPELCLRMAQFSRRAGEADLALRCCEGALTLDPAFAPALSLKGAVLLDLGREEEAERVLRAAGEGESAFAQPHALLGILAARREDWRSARREFTRALVLEPNQPDILHDRALAALADGDPPSAEADLRAALEVAPDHRRARARLAGLLLQAGKRGEAGEVLCGGCAAVQASALDSDSLREMLLMAAQAGFPPCVREWLERTPPGDSDSMRLAKAYLGAEARTLGNQQR